MIEFLGSPAFAIVVYALSAFALCGFFITVRQDWNGK